MNKYLTVLIALLISLVPPVVILATEQELISSTTVPLFETKTTGGGTGDPAYVYADFLMCPLELTLIDPDDTLWEVIFIEAMGNYALDSMGCGFINTGCIGTNIKLAVECTTWTTNISYPTLPGDERFILWATAISRWHGGYERDDFWPGPTHDRTVCAVDKIPNYDKISLGRFYNYEPDLPPFLAPPMDSTGLNLHPRSRFILLLLLQAPTSVPEDTATATIILHVVAEPMTY